MPNESKAVTSYYCMLNAAKSMLSANKIDFKSYHGLSGKSNGSKTSLANEVSEIKNEGILISLAEYYKLNLHKDTFSLKDILYNIPFVHRSFTVTYKGTQNLFIPIVNTHFVKQKQGKEAWFCAEITDQKYCKKSFFAKQGGWEHDKGQDGKFIIRRKHRFRWDTSRGVKKADRIKNLVKYHNKIRRDIKYIHGAQRLWYYKRNDKEEQILHWPIPILIFTAMHRLSELTRYDPKRLRRHFECQHNWLLSVFLNLATDNFIDQIASDITGHELMIPGYR